MSVSHNRLSKAMMNRTALIKLSLGLGVVLVITAPIGAIAAPVPAPQVQSEDVVQWEPLARIKLDQPFQVEIKNTTPESLDYVVSTQTNFRTIAPGETVTMNSLKLPLFLNINAQRSTGVKYLLSVAENRVKVSLKLTPGQGDTTLNIDDKGAIYLY
jgi:biopolymer transport protein ExbD